MLTPRSVISTLLVGALLWGAAWSIKQSQAGTKPTVAYVAQNPDTPVHTDEEIFELKKVADQNPRDKEAAKRLSQVLLEKLQQNPQPPQGLIFDTIDAFKKVLELDGTDQDALVAMADISFNAQVFDKATHYFERYLALNPRDDAVRTRYASALTFVGRGTDAIRELRSLLDKDPKNFHAAAYISITYAQMGDISKSLAEGQRALALAPSDEARARFVEFLDTVKDRPQELRVTAVPQASSPPVQGTGDLEALLRKNPIAGPRFVRLERRSEHSVALYFKGFPMQQMPQFAKDRFLTPLKEKALTLGLKELLFIDDGNGDEMEKVEIR